MRRLRHASSRQRLKLHRGSKRYLLRQPVLVLFLAFMAFTDFGNAGSVEVEASMTLGPGAAGFVSCGPSLDEIVEVLRT